MFICCFNFREEKLNFAKEMHSWGLESITALALDTRLTNDYGIHLHIITWYSSRLGCLDPEKQGNLAMVDLVHR